jgi:UDP-N-acetylmuramoyl-tripeptide--D-alanyl-D-alanine ligase
MIWNKLTLSEALGITINFPISANQVQFNSKDVQKGDLFIALKGNGDGHDYLMHAIKQGASGVIIDKEINPAPRDKTILVENTFAALKKMAEYKRRRSEAVFIGITGSVGKTSTKEALKTVLSAFEPATFAGRGNFNNYLGVLLNLASMPDDTKYAIFELGMNHSGEIRELVQIIKPYMAIITNISEAHLEFFDSINDIVAAKCEIFEGLDKNGIAIVNLDNNYYDNILSILANLSINQIHSFGTSDKAFSRLLSYKTLGQEVHLIYNLNGDKIEMILPFIPEHYAKNYAAILLAIAVLGKDISGVAKYLSEGSITQGRGEIITINNHRIICDYYNASPESMKAALKYLKQLNGAHKVAIIGEMLELGQSSKRLHEDLVPYILESGCNKVFLIGTNTKHIYELLPSSLTKAYFTNVDNLIKNLPTLLGKDELILIKGSRGVKLEKIIANL